jgi:hypothetical protein
MDQPNTQIERGYVEQGYVLPEGMTWSKVAESRARSEILEILVPVARVSGVVGWGVPIINGKFLQHP